MTLHFDQKGCMDIIEGLKKINLPIFLAKAEIRQRYRRSTLGPFWITISTGVMIGTIGIIFGKIFNAPTHEFLPYLAAGLILWTFISSTINDSTAVFVHAEASIRQLSLPLFIYVEKLIARNFYIFLHNLVIFPLVCFGVGKSLNLRIFLAAPGVLLVVFNLLWISLLLGIVCARYRDLTQIVASVVQILFYTTPIIWMPGQVNARVTTWLVIINPFYHLLSVVRDPLLGSTPAMSSWIISVAFGVTGWIFTVLLFNKYKWRIAYWL